MHRLFSVTLLLAASSSLAQWQQQGAGSATFDAKGTIGIKIHGTTKELTVSDDGNTFCVSIPVTTIDTDNSLRNGHMREDIAAATFPTMVFSIATAALVAPSPGEQTVERTLTGELSWHGKRVKVPFTYRATRASDGVAIEASAVLNLTDFDVKIRSYLGVGVKPEVAIGVQFRLRPPG